MPSRQPSRHGEFQQQGDTVSGWPGRCATCSTGWIGWRLVARWMAIPKCGSEKRVLFMEFTSEDAAVMYARACRAWYGRRAPRIVKDKIEELRRAGDDSGIIAWSQVLTSLNNYKPSPSRSTRKRADRPLKFSHAPNRPPTVATVNDGSPNLTHKVNRPILQWFFAGWFFHNRRLQYHFHPAAEGPAPRLATSRPARPMGSQSWGVRSAPWSDEKSPSLDFHGSESP
jgi:hypothetical protein